MLHDTHIAIVGDGAAALATLAVLRRAGAREDTVAVYGDGAHPLERLERYARAVGQERMRSEGDGHLGPAGFPDLALLDSWRSRSPLPALASLFNMYTPPLDLLLEHAAGVARSCGFEEARVPVWVGRLVRRERPRCEFVLEDERGRAVGRARHVVLALGHPGLRWPAAAGSWRFHPRISHAYQSPRFEAGERVVVVGGGTAAAHAWLAALGAGASVTALHRSPLRRQQLNAARCMFSSVGIETYRRLGPEERLERLRGQGGSFPRRWEWERRLRLAGRAGRFATHQGELRRIEAGSEGIGGPLALRLTDGGTLDADRLIFATGFQPDPCGHEVVRRLVEEYGVPRAGVLLRVHDDCTLPPLSRPESVLATVGALARWALPTADTFFGMKYAARRLAPLLV
ncbi:MAG: hypothetical protein RLZZ387_1345 [Chloroflexota bacterium]|jgi:thioredoxin reductase